MHPDPASHVDADQDCLSIQVKKEKKLLDRGTFTFLLI
jgi:hypothetical protein